MTSEAPSLTGLSIPRVPAIALASDHAGFPQKATVAAILARHCDRVIELGAVSETPVDFPDVTRETVELIRRGTVARAILVCGTGAGACIAANKVNGIRAAVAHDTFVARQCVEHDDVNVLCIGAWIVGPQIMSAVVQTFLAASFSSEPHFRRRVAKLARLEEEMRGEVRTPP